MSNSGPQIDNQGPQGPGPSGVDLCILDDFDLSGKTYCSAGGLTARPASSSSRSPGWSSELPHCSFFLHHLGDDAPKHLGIVELKSSRTFSVHFSQNQQHFFQEAERNIRICIRCCFVWRCRFIVDKPSEPRENVYLEETLKYLYIP